MIYIDHTNPIPLYRQIYNEVKQEIREGARREGDKMPSIRSLARLLEVSVSTVVQAYEMLVAEGYLLNSKGSGHYVNRMELPVVPQLQQADDMEADRKERKYRYSMAKLNTDMRYFPVRKFMRAMNQGLTVEIESGMSPNYEFGMLPELQRELSKFLRINRGVTCRPEQILISSAGHNLFHVLIRILYEKYGILRILLEDPCQNYLVQVFRGCGLEIIPISMTEEGINLEQVMQYDHCAVLVTPGNQFPTGSRMSVQNRIRLLDWAEASNSFILEDDRLGTFSYKTKPMFALQSMGASQRVICMNSINYYISPSIRFCYAVIPELWTRYYKEIYADYPGEVPLFLQKGLALFMKEGYAEAYEKKIVRIYQKKREFFVKRLREETRGAVLIIPSNGGVSIRVQSAGAHTEEQLVTLAAEQGVQVLPLSVCWIRKENYSWNQVQLCFSGLAMEELEEVACLLGKAWRIE